MSIFRRDHAPKNTPSTETETISFRLARASSPEERQAIWEEHLAGAGGRKFDKDCRRVGELLLDGDRTGLIAFATEATPERAAARAMVIREVSPPEA